MTWKFVASDNYSVEDLLDYEIFFMTDLASAEYEVTKHLKLQKWGLPNWRVGYIRRKMGVSEAQNNVRIVKEAIKLAKAKGL